MTTFIESVLNDSNGSQALKLAEPHWNDLSFLRGFNERRCNCCTCCDDYVDTYVDFGKMGEPYVCFREPYDDDDDDDDVLCVCKCVYPTIISDKNPKVLLLSMDEKRTICQYLKHEGCRVMCQDLDNDQEWKDMIIETFELSEEFIQDCRNELTIINFRTFNMTYNALVMSGLQPLLHFHN